MCRVLVVDDDDDLRSLLEITFSSECMQVQAANSPTSALDVLKWFNPDVIILDYTFPGMCGESLFDSLPRHRAEIIVLTGRVEAHDPKFRARLLQKGAVYVLHKPFDVIELKAMVVRATEYRRALEMLRSTEEYQSGRLLEQLRQSVVELEETRIHMNGRA